MSRRPQVALSPDVVRVAYAQFGTTEAAATALNMTYKALDKRLERSPDLKAAARAGRAEFKAEHEPMHGEYRRYGRGCRCDLCRRANAQEKATLRAERLSRATPPHVHGTYGGYTNYGCRCLKCKAAHSAACADYQSRRRAAQVLPSPGAHPPAR